MSERKRSFSSRFNELRERFILAGLEEQILILAAAKQLVAETPTNELPTLDEEAAPDVVS